MRARVLGSSAGGGLPQWNCACRNCSAVRHGSTDIEARTQDSVLVTTDDGSAGRKGLVTAALAGLIDQEPVHRVIAVGPIPMMRAVAETTRASAIKTIVSLNPIMVDGTGMCGGCRVEVGGDTKFACVDGPEFDAHLVDFDELVRRNRMYQAQERHEGGDPCRLRATVPQ